MNKKIVIMGILAIALILLIGGCGQQTTPAKKKTNASSTGASATQRAQGDQRVENVTPVDVESLPEPSFSLQYCNERLNDIRNDLQNAQDNLADEQGDLQGLQAEPRSTERDSAIANTNTNIRALTNEVSSLQRGLESIDDKCKRLTPAVCAEFVADATDELNEAKQELLNEQQELNYIREARKQELQRRKLILLERQVTEWAGIVEELQTKCP